MPRVVEGEERDCRQLGGQDDPAERPRLHYGVDGILAERFEEAGDACPGLEAEDVDLSVFVVSICFGRQISIEHLHRRLA